MKRHIKFAGTKFAGLTDMSEVSLAMLQAFPNDRIYPFDANLEFSDNAVAITATGWTQKGGSNGIIDLGGNQGTSPKQQARGDFVAVCDVTAITVSVGCSYKIMVLLSNDPAFGVGNVEQAGEIMVGVAASRDGTNMMTSVIGTYEIQFASQVAGNLYQYAGVWVIVAGASASISIEGYFAPTPEM